MAAAKDEKANISARTKDDGVEVYTPNEMSWCRQLLAIKNTLIIVLTPILLLPIFIASTSTVSFDTIICAQFEAMGVLLDQFGRGGSRHISR